MADILLDITVFEDYRRGDSGAQSIINRIIDGDISASVSPLTILHLWGSPDFDRKAEIAYTGMLRFMEEASLTNDAAKTAGIWIAALPPEDRGKLMYFALVAATAKERDESLCTRNAEIFSQFNLEITDY